MSTSTTVALQSATGSAIAAAGGSVTPWRGSQSSTELLRRIVTRLIGLTGNTREYPGTDNAALLTRFQSAMAQQSGATGASAFVSESNTKLLQYLAATVGVDGTESPYPSWDNTKLLRLALGAVMDPNSGSVSQIFGPVVIEVADANARLSLPPNTAVGTKVHQVDNDTIYQLNAPSTALGGVFVSGGTQDGVYAKGLGQSSGKDFFVFLGVTQAAGDALNTIEWNVLRSNAWSIASATGDELYYSLSNVATPDLVTASGGVFVVDFNPLVVDGSTSYGACQVGGAAILQFDSGTALADSTPGSFLGFGGADGLGNIGVSDSPTKQQIINKLVAMSAGKIVDLGGLRIQVTPGIVTTVDAVVSGAGISGVNDHWRRAATLYNGKHFYDHGTLDDIYWGLDNKWHIGLNGGSPQYYFSTDSVSEPWLVTTWQVGANGTAPVPTVTQGSHQEDHSTDLLPMNFSGMTGSGFTTPPTGWFNASDDSPASIAVTSVSVDDINSGYIVTNAADSSNNGVFTPDGNNLGLEKYTQVSGGAYIQAQVDDILNWNILGNTNEEATDLAGAFPSSAAWPSATVTKSRPAGDANWQVVP